MQQNTEQSCHIHFIDCMGYYDLGSQIISIIMIGFIIYKTSNNIYNLLSQKQYITSSNIEAHKSIIRKLIINIISFSYIILLSTSILFSIIIFLTYFNNLQELKSTSINLWYKWSEIIFIVILNILNLTVGFIYWKAVRAYFKISQTNLPIIYYRHVKLLVFGLFYLVNVGVIIVSLIMLLICDDQAHYEKYEVKVVNCITAISVGCSTIICLASRLLYQKYILNNISLNSVAIKKQQIYSILICFSSMFRLSCVTMNLLGIDYYEYLRVYSEQCLDVMPYHALVMLIVTICVNMIPVFIFNYIFACSYNIKRSNNSNKSNKKHYKQIDEYLCKNNSKQSVRYV